MYGIDREQILQYVTDPAKVKVVNTLPEEVLASLASHYCTEEQAALWNTDPNLLAIRVIYFRRLADWGSEPAEKMYEEYAEFISDPTFVQYPECLTDPAIVKATRVEMINPHYRRLESYPDYEIEIIGARIVDSGVEVLVSHNQLIDPKDGYGYTPASQKEYKIPPTMKRGILKRNPAYPMSGVGGEVYIGMQGFNGNDHMELVINSDTSQKKEL